MWWFLWILRVNFRLLVANLCISPQMDYLEISILPRHELKMNLPKVFRSHNTFRYAEWQGEGSGFRVSSRFRDRNEHSFHHHKLFQMHKTNYNKFWFAQVCVKVRVELALIALATTWYKEERNYLISPKIMWEVDPIS